LKKKLEEQTSRCKSQRRILAFVRGGPNNNEEDDAKDEWGKVKMSPTKWLFIQYRFFAVVPSILEQLDLQRRINNERPSTPDLKIMPSP
jgi:hypothetical protein